MKLFQKKKYKSTLHVCCTCGKQSEKKFVSCDQCHGKMIVCLGFKD